MSGDGRDTDCETCDAGGCWVYKAVVSYTGQYESW